MRVRIEYADQNENFANYLPVTGTAGRTIKFSVHDRPWLVVELDAPIDYQLKIGEPLQFRRLIAHELVIASRVEGADVGTPGPVDVYILMPLELSATHRDVADVNAFYKAAWGRCTTLDRT